MENRNSNQPPIACDLTVFSLGERERHLALSQELFAACGKMRELSDGFTFLFTGKGTWCATPIAARSLSVFASDGWQGTSVDRGHGQLAAVVQLLGATPMAERPRLLAAVARAFPQLDVKSLPAGPAPAVDELDSFNLRSLHRRLPQPGRPNRGTAQNRELFQQRHLGALS